MKKLLIILAIWSVSACRQDDPSNLNDMLNVEPTLHAGESVKLARESAVTDLSVEVIEILESRCPIDAQCVWAGNARVTVAINHSNVQQQIIILCLGDCRNGESAEAEFELAGEKYRIILKSVDPYPILNVPVTEKTATFEFEEIG